MIVDTPSVIKDWVDNGWDWDDDWEILHKTLPSGILVSVEPLREDDCCFCEGSRYTNDSEEYCNLHFSVIMYLTPKDTDNNHRPLHLANICGLANVKDTLKLVGMLYVKEV